MDIIITLIIGGIIGWLASMIMKTDAQMGLIANIVVGIVGSFLGFWIAGQLGFAENQAIGPWVGKILNRFCRPSINPQMLRRLNE